MSAFDLYWYIEGITTAFFACMIVMTLSMEQNRVRRMLIYNLVAWLVMHIMPVIFPAQYISDEFRICAIINGYDMMALPLCAGLLTELCNPGHFTVRRLIMGEIPIIVIQTAYVILNIPIIYTVLIAYCVLYALCYAVMIPRWIRRYNEFLKENFSYTENLSLRWIYKILVVMLVILVLWICTLTINSIYVDCAFLAFTVFSWSLVCRYAQRQESILEEIEENNKETSKDTTDSPETTAAPAIDLSELITKHVIDTKLYLNQKLTLTDMAREIGTNRTYLSRYLNESLNTNFYEYINGLRIDYASRLMQNSNMNLSAISRMAGFSSYTTFRRAYINRFGTPPSKKDTPADLTTQI